MLFKAERRRHCQKLTFRKTPAPSEPLHTENYNTNGPIHEICVYALSTIQSAPGCRSLLLFPLFPVWSKRVTSYWQYLKYVQRCEFLTRFFFVKTVLIEGLVIEISRFLFAQFLVFPFSKKMGQNMAMRSLPNTLPSVKFPNFGNFSCFSCFPCFSWTKEENTGKTCWMRTAGTYIVLQQYVVDIVPKRSIYRSINIYSGVRISTRKKFGSSIMVSIPRYTMTIP